MLSVRPREMRKTARTHTHTHTDTHFPIAPARKTVYYTQLHSYTKTDAHTTPYSRLRQSPIRLPLALAGCGIKICSKSEHTHTPTFSHTPNIIQFQRHFDVHNNPPAARTHARVFVRGHTHTHIAHCIDLRKVQTAPPCARCLRICEM